MRFTFNIILVGKENFDSEDSGRSVPRPYDSEN